MKTFSGTTAENFLITRLGSGGIITNYHCTSACKHCLYACGPRREKDYIDSETLVENLKIIKSMGCRSVHVGGGEPFLNSEGLEMVLETSLGEGVSVEYVETNSSWFKDRKSARELLFRLKRKGLNTLLVSMSPFHAEHIPFYKVKGVLQACRDEGINVFPWISEFYPEIDTFDDRRIHKLSEFSDRFGRDYIREIPSRYWVHIGGRAVETLASVFDLFPLEEVLSKNRGGCRELTDVSHFHMDLHGNYIPGLCAGLAINRSDLGKPLSFEQYPFLTTLFSSGISGLLETAREDYGFEPDGAYLSKCHLCLEIRKFLMGLSNLNFEEFKPAGFYDNCKKDYYVYQGD